MLGVVPFLTDLEIPEEDAVALAAGVRVKCVIAIGSSDRSECIDIAVIQLPHIANFDDFDPLRRESDVRLRYVASVGGPGPAGRRDSCRAPRRPWRTWPGCGSAACDQAVCRLAEAGTAVVGICGGYQMLGQSIRDPDHVESSQEEMSNTGNRTR